MRTTALPIILAVTFVFSIGGVGFIWSQTSDAKARNEIRAEVAKSLLQLAVVGVIGGVVASLLKSVEIDRADRNKAAENRRERFLVLSGLRTDYLQRVGTAYRNTKVARRALIAGGLSSSNPIGAPQALSKEQAVVYRREMGRVNSAQLELEKLRIEANSLPGLASLSGLRKQLRTMEDYLRTILQEFESVGPLLTTGGDVEFGSLERLGEFTTETKDKFVFVRYKDKCDYRFESHFATQHGEVIKAIAETLKEAHNSGLNRTAPLRGTAG